MHSRRVVGTVLALCAAACGRPADPPAPASSDELARMHREGELDPTRLACAMTAVPELTESVGPVLLELASPGPVRYRATSDHARSVQQGMAARDAQDGAMSAAAAMRRQSAAADRAGQRSLAVRYSAYAATLQREAQNMPPTGGVAAYRPGEGVDEPSGAELLLEYAFLQADLAALDPEREEGSAEIGRRARIEAIAVAAPEVAEAYSDLLLYVYRDPQFGCPSETPSG